MHFDFFVTFYGSTDGNEHHIFLLLQTTVVTDSYTPQTLRKNRNPLLKFSCCETKFLMQEIYVFLRKPICIENQKESCQLIYLCVFLPHTPAYKKEELGFNWISEFDFSIYLCVYLCVDEIPGNCGETWIECEWHELWYFSVGWEWGMEGGRFWKLLADIENWSIEHYESPMNYASVNHARTKAKANKEERERERGRGRKRKMSKRLIIICIKYCECWHGKTGSYPFRHTLHAKNKNCNWNWVVFAVHI